MTNRTENKENNRNESVNLPLIEEVREFIARELFRFSN